jgi:exodeoxyribonuclease VII small subunit
MPPSRKSSKRSAATASDPTPGTAAGELAGLSFEASLERLEGVVDRLERGELELEESLAAFEEGVQLSARCAAQLAQAEQRIELLMQQGGEWVSRPFDPVDEVTEGDAEEAS